MKTYRNDPAFKAMFVAEIERHRDADQIIQGSYGHGTGNRWRGCAVGCSIHSLSAIEGTDLDVSDHRIIENYGLWPEWLTHLEDTIFEGLPTPSAREWPVTFANAVPVGVDLTPVKSQFLIFILRENRDRVLRLDISADLRNQAVNAIDGALQLHESTESAVESAEFAAWSAAKSARSAAWSAEFAAWSAAEFAAWSAAKSAAYIKYAAELISLLQKAH